MKKKYKQYEVAEILGVTERTLYNWKTRYEQQAYDFVREETKAGLTTYQTGLIWDKIEGKIPEPLRYEAHECLTKVISNVSEEEISLVKNALTAF